MEMVVTHNNQIRDFKYFATFNFSYVHNEITDLKEGDTPGRSVGDPINNIYGYVCEGIFRDQAEIDAHPKQITGDVVPGDLKYKDLNGDGIVDDKDRKSLGTYFPKITSAYAWALNIRILISRHCCRGAGHGRCDSKGTGYLCVL